MRFAVLAVLLLNTLHVLGQSFDTTGVFYANQIERDSISKYLKVLSSDSLEGRETGERGQKMAATFIANHFRKLGIAGGGDSLDYFQRFHLYAPVLGKSQLRIDDVSFIDLKDYYSFTPLCDTVIAEAELVFLGYGITREGYDNYQNKDVIGKIGVIYRGEPSGKQTYWGTDFTLKSDLAKQHGLTGIIVIDEGFLRKLPRAKKYMAKNKLKFYKPKNTRIPVVHIGESTLASIFSKADMKSIRKGMESGAQVFDLKGSHWCKLSYPEKVKHVVADNVIGWIPGSKNPDEYVFLTAHYDHLGKRGDVIYNGADDDGSGTSALMEIARVFKQAEQEQNGLGRSVVFLFVSGEEKGLLGSSYYVDNPLFPLSQTVTDLNIDMIGRRDTEHEADSSKYLYVIGSDMLSQELHEISESTNEKYFNFAFDYRYNDPEDPMRLYYRSDHYNFAKYNIPVIFYFRGLHADYHKPTDTFEKVDCANIEEVARLIFMTAREVGNRQDRLVVKEIKD